MKKWLAWLLVFVMAVSVLPVAAAADTSEEEVLYYTLRVLCEEEYGKAYPGEDVPVAAGGQWSVYFRPNEGYEVVTVFVDGYPVSRVYELEAHCADCEGCDECSWIEWEKVYEGFEKDDWSDWKHELTFRNMSADHVVYADFAPVRAEEAPEEERPEAGPKPEDYTDLDPKAWYAADVAYALEQGLMNGMGEGKFAPNGITTRAQLVTILWRLEGQPVVHYRMDFTDVTADDWYAEAVRWAAAEKIVTGHGSTFAPDAPVTREQLAAILWRYATYQEMDVSVGENTNILSYEDAFDISDYAYAPLQWACGAGIMNGSNGRLNPQGNANRAQVAAMLHRFLTI